METAPKTPVARCPLCHGSGVEVDWRLRRPITGPCLACHGTGKYEPSEYEPPLIVEPVARAAYPGGG